MGLIIYSRMSNLACRLNNNRQPNRVFAMCCESPWILVTLSEKKGKLLQLGVVRVLLTVTLLYPGGLGQQNLSPFQAGSPERELGGQIN